MRLTSTRVPTLVVGSVQHFENPIRYVGIPYCVRSRCSGLDVEHHVALAGRLAGKHDAHVAEYVHAGTGRNSLEGVMEILSRMVVQPGLGLLP
jgi:hypothetical protein